MKTKHEKHKDMRPKKIKRLNRDAHETNTYGDLVRRVSVLEENMSVIIGTLGDLQDRFEAEDNLGHGTHPDDEETHWLDSPVRVTADQAKSMSDAGGWIMGWDEKGWLFIGNLESSPNDEGNGCWHDKAGNEQHGPTA